MAAHREQPPLTLRPGLSPRLAAFVSLTHLLAAVALALLPAPWPLLLPAVAASFAYELYGRVLGRAPWSIQSAIWQSDGRWTIVLRSGVEREARLAPSTFVSVPLVVLNLRRGALRRWSLPLFADALDPESGRRLRQRLRMEGSAPNPDR